MAHSKGETQVYLVGAGPGDPGLLTLKGRAAIERADVLVYDRLVSPRLLGYARPDCELVYVGKTPDHHTLPQHKINALLVKKALAGNVVVRLKGGDPFVFGRGGEEAEELRAHGLSYEVVPGVTSAIAAPAYAGIPVTHRDAASSFTVITGHERDGKGVSAIPWGQVARLKGTLVFLMGMENLPRIVDNLVGHGMDPATPAAVVRYGTWPMQRTVRAPLAALEERVGEEGIENPAVIVVGQVAALRERLSWAERKPLFGKTVVVTRARHQASALASALEERGAQVLEFPAIEIAPPTDPQPLAEAVAGIEAYRWVVLTSANGVDAFFAEAAAQRLDARCLAGAEVAAIGTGTQAALAAYGITQVHVAREFCAEGLAGLLAGKVRAGDRVLIARAEEARDVLPRALEEQGAQVSDVAAYRPRAGRPVAARGGRPVLHRSRDHGDAARGRPRAPRPGGRVHHRGPRGRARRYARRRAPMKMRKRPRRLRETAGLRAMVREHHVRVDDLVYPLFVCSGTGKQEPVPSMPGVFHYSLDRLGPVLDEVAGKGIPAILLFGLPAFKDARGTQAYAEDGIVQQAVALAKERQPALTVITDVCLCEYTDHGHCGLVDGERVLNDESVALLAATAVSHARAGADIVAPSDMMDGRVGAIRDALDENGFEHVAVMSYAAKFASAFYGPFREAADSAPQFGDRKSYQMDPANGDEALREVMLDVEEGADLVIVKPALAYGDVLYRTKQACGLPVAAYCVSGEYAMVKAAAAQGWIDERRVVMVCIYE